MGKRRDGKWRNRLSGFAIGRAEWTTTVIGGISAGLCLAVVLWVGTSVAESDPQMAERSTPANARQKWVVADMDTGRPAPLPVNDHAEPVPAPLANAVFSLCHIGGGTNCVVDGDTFWMDGLKIRVADIDAPETHSPRCAAEAALGNRATLRLQQLLNAGPITLEQVDRDEDRYGRKLRVLLRQGRSLGDILVSEGLARPYQGGPRAGWC